MTLVLWMFFVAASPEASARLAATIVGVPAQELVAVCRRESRCRVVGVHEGDAWASRLVHERARFHGWIPRGCPRTVWSTRGSFGLMAGYHLWRVVGPTCWAWLMDLPLVAAFAAASKYKDRCVRDRGDSWCPNVRRARKGTHGRVLNPDPLLD